MGATVSKSTAQLRTDYKAGDMPSAADINRANRFLRTLISNTSIVIFRHSENGEGIVCDIDEDELDRYLNEEYNITNVINNIIEAGDIDLSAIIDTTSVDVITSISVDTANKQIKKTVKPLSLSWAAGKIKLNLGTGTTTVVHTGGDCDGS